MTARKVIELYWEYCQPRLSKRFEHPKGYGPKNYDRRGERRGGIRFWAWIRVVTEPRYEEFEKLLKGGWECPEFEAILAESLKIIPFDPPKEESRTASMIRDPFIPVSAACIYASVTQPTISRWIDRGLKHEKRGGRYFVDINNLEWYASNKGKEKVKLDNRNTEKTGVTENSWKTQTSYDTMGQVA